jgi:5,10-methylenetetrahydrofolate reductase
MIFPVVELEIYAELEPSRDPQVILNRLERLSREYGKVDIPDIPLGKPSIFSPALAVLARERYGVDVIAHLRVQDHNILAIKSITKTLKYSSVHRIIYLHGDPPLQGKSCQETWEPEEAVSYANSYNIESGLLLSPRKSWDEITRRLRSGASYYYFTRVNLGVIKKVYSYIREEKIKGNLASYIVVASKENIEYLNNYNIPHIPATEIPKMIRKLEELGVKRVILSAPGYNELLLKKDLLTKLKDAGVIG